MTMPTASLMERQEHMITQQELQAARNTLYRGKPVSLVDYRKLRNDCPNYIIQDEVLEWYPHVIKFKSGCTYTMVEYAAYLRNISIPLGKHPMSGNAHVASHVKGIISRRNKK